MQLDTIPTDRQLKQPFVSRRVAERIACAYPTPFYLYDERTIRERVTALHEAFSWDPGFKEYFAVKATPNPSILGLLARLGCGFDCAGTLELVLASACGVTGNDLILSSNQTPDEDFRLAASMGAIINLDAAELACDLLRVLEGALPATVCLRVNPGGDVAGSNAIFGSPQDSKFGMTFDQAFATARLLKERGVREIGLHALLASNCIEPDYYPRLAATLFNLAVRIQSATGVHVAFVDLSGGVGVAYRPDETPLDIAAIGEGVQHAQRTILAPAGMEDTHIYTELGRWILAPAGALVTRVLHKKHTYHEYVGVDACAANLMRPAIYGAYHHISVLGREDEPASHTYSVVGGLCENSDHFARDRHLPYVERGDLLFIHDAGAHGHAMGYNYNGRLRSAELLLHEDGSVELIRRAETPEDYVATVLCGPYGEAIKRKLAAVRAGE